MNKTVTMSIRVSEDELDKLKLAAKIEAYSSYSEFVRRTALIKANEVVLTGFPRFDNLYNDEEKIIAIIPTWRQNIAGKYDQTTGLRDYNPNFKNSDYFIFYNDLINDKELLKSLQENNYKMYFVLHASHEKQIVDFKANDYIKIISGNVDYQEIFRKSRLLLTDYSSVAFDFGYLRKPVVYTHFDEKTFFQGHLYKEGYFSYEKDGFGPIINNKNQLVDYIINMIETDFMLKEKYRKRIDSFFKFSERNNCKRVYEAIIEGDNHEKQ